MGTMKINIGENTHVVSSTLYGLFLEDINFSCDGGLNTNVIRNHSFDATRLDESYNQMEAIQTRRAPEVYEDHLRFWEIEGGKLESRDDAPASVSNPWYARVSVNSEALLKNKGYDGGSVHQGECGIGTVKEHSYHFSAYVRNTGYEGKVTVYVEGEDGNRLSDEVSISLTNEWSKQDATLSAKESGRGKLVIQFKGKGTLDIDCVSLSDTDVWGAGDSKWSGGRFRRDMVEALKELKPTFLRFPGGCIVEGAYPGNEYQWKNTVGPVIDRIPAINLWGAVTNGKDYCQSYHIGFYEYFLLCEDLKMEPMPIVWAGLNCQFRSDEFIDADNDEFNAKVVQNALDLIEYANGDPNESKWAKLRADAGHPEPFNMKMIGIGNENYGAQYHKNFEVVKKAVQDKYPDMKCIMSSGPFPQGELIEKTWEVANEKFRDVVIDEHFYKSNEWVYSQVNRYDDYPRDTAKVFLGEYAANDLGCEHKMNTFGSALAEAAFLTGVERNSDVVVLTSYAPLFAMSEGAQWGHNMIWFNAEHVMKTANYYVQQMYGAHIGDQVCSLNGEVPENVYVVATEDAEKVYVKIANAGKENVDMELSVGDRNVKTVTHICLHSDDLDCANELPFAGTPAYNIVPSTNVLEANGSTVVCEVLGNSVNVFEIQK